MKRNSTRWSRLVALLIGFAFTAVAGRVDPVYQHGGLAIRGFDPVAYYQQSAPVKGSPQFSYQWQGANGSLRVPKIGTVFRRSRTLRASVRRLLRLCGQQGADGVDRP